MYETLVDFILRTIIHGKDREYEAAVVAKFFNEESCSRMLSQIKSI